MIPKFRAWDKENKKILVVNDICNLFWENTFLECYELAPDPKGKREYELINHRIDFEDCVVMQSTGLFDKNGVEIFEKDIVMDDSGKINKIVFTEYEDTDYYGQTHMGFISENDDYVDQFVTLPSLIKKGIKIIGNIYELESVEE